MDIVNQSLSVLHLDDDPLFLDQFRDTLLRNKLGIRFSVTSCDTLEGFLQKLNSGINPDVIVLDINLDSKGGSGLDVAVTITRRFKDTVTVMCSDHHDTQTVNKSLRLGAHDFIFKGADENELPLRIYGAFQLFRSSNAKSQAKVRSGAKRIKAPVIGDTMVQIAGRIPRIIDSAITSVYVFGESGTGKELVSELFESHIDSGVPFIRVNCGAISSNLIESELFGHVKGSFTGANQDRKGFIEAADGGWVFLDEIATLSMSAQIALLRTLESHTIRKVGSSYEKKISVKVLSASNENIADLVEKGTFRQDLWQRLREAVIELPPLRDRMGEFNQLVEHICTTMTNGPYRISPSVLELLSRYHWRGGNIRQLRNCLRAMTELSVDKLLTPISLPSWFWSEIDGAGIKETGTQPTLSEERSGSPGYSKIVLELEKLQGLSFELLSYHLLYELIKLEFQKRGKMSLRSLSSIILVPRSTLSSKLRSLVYHNIVPLDTLAKMVGINKNILQGAEKE